MKPNCVVTGGTPDLALPAIVFFESMKQFSPELFDGSDKLFFASNEIAAKDRETLAAMDVEVAELPLEAIEHDNKYARYFTNGLLSKFEVFRLSQRYKRVAWFDCDQICIRELKDIVDAEYGSSAICIAHGGASSIEANFHFEALPDEVKQAYNFNVDQICGNFFFLTTDLSDAYEWLRTCYYELGEYLKLPDQGVLCFMFQHFDVDVHYFENAVFTPHPKDWPLTKLLKTERALWPYLVHCYGQPKFWDGCDYPVWDELCRSRVGDARANRQYALRESAIKRMSRNLRRHAKKYGPSFFSK